MEPFTRHAGKAAVLDWSDVNTDLIIPARYLKRVERVGFGPLLFADKRYAPGAAPEPDAPEGGGALAEDFPLNRAEAAGADILLVGKNFGCGSSREHAVWAVAQAGFKVLIAPGIDEGFADIFERNALNNGLLPIELPDADWERLRAAALSAGASGLRLIVDLEAETLGVEGSPEVLRFRINPTDRERLLKGLDAVGETMAFAEAIGAHEASAPDWAMLRASG